jgi:hypothetical protein
VFVPRFWRPTYDEAELRAVIAASWCYSEALRRLGLRPAGHNHRTIQRHVAYWGISTEHFDPNAARRAATSRRGRPLEEILVEDSTYSRGSLKRRLYSEGLKDRRCELCGQDEEWHGERMSLILDHVNGEATDNRIENLQIVCPNCAATLDTHCGRNKANSEPRECPGCTVVFEPRAARQRYCSQRCAGLAHADRTPRPETRKVERPPYEQLMAELAASNYSAVGRKYGVSDNAVRKWVRWYEQERTDEAA